MTDDLTQAPRRRLRVVITDDSEAIRASLSGLMTRIEDIEIVGLARNGTEALELARRLKPDAMTLDIRMPDMNGIRVLEAIKREGLDVMVIVLTAMDDPAYQQRCLNLGASHFFNKSTEFELLMKVLADKAANLNPV